MYLYKIYMIIIKKWKKIIIIFPLLKINNSDEGEKETEKNVNEFICKKCIILILLNYFGREIKSTAFL